MFDSTTRLAGLLTFLGGAAAMLALGAAVVSPAAPDYLAQHAILGLHLARTQVYAFFWTSGGIVGAVAAMLTAYVRGFLTIRTFLAGVLWTIGLIFGAKLEFRLETAEVLDPAASGLIDAGMRLPLGILCGGVLAWAWCRVTRASWLGTGDALAVYATLMIAIGRTGCLLAGCCTGRICPAWMSPVCLRYPSGSQPYLEQLRAGVLTGANPVTRPIHPLPLYFALAAVVTLMVLVVLLKRKAPPGAMLVAFTLLWPISKLGLEQLRATPRAPGLILGIPAVILAVALVAASRIVRRPGREGSSAPAQSVVGTTQRTNSS